MKILSVFVVFVCFVGFDCSVLVFAMYFSMCCKILMLWVYLCPKPIKLSTLDAAFLFLWFYD